MNKQMMTVTPVQYEQDLWTAVRNTWRWMLLGATLSGCASTEIYHKPCAVDGVRVTILSTGQAMHYCSNLTTVAFATRKENEAGVYNIIAGDEVAKGLFPVAGCVDVISKEVVLTEKYREEWGRLWHYLLEAYCPKGGR